MSNKRHCNAKARLWRILASLTTDVTVGGHVHRLRSRQERGRPPDNYISVIHVQKDFACSSIHTVILHANCLSSMPVTPMTWLRRVTFPP